MASVIIKRAIFAVEFFKIIKKDDILINIDESSISKNTRASRSWSIRVEVPELKSINVAESISLISWISSTGWHFNHIRNKSINSQILANLLQIYQNSWIWDNWRKEGDQYFNSKMHSYISKRMFKKYWAKPLIEWYICPPTPHPSPQWNITSLLLKAI